MTEDIILSIQISKYFFLLENFFKKYNNNALIDNLLLTFLYRLYYPKLFLPCILYHYWV